jgi:hypothetical protein
VKYSITQAELCEAVQLYLNERVLKRPVTVTKVETEMPNGRSYGVSLKPIEAAIAEDDQQQVAPEARDAGAAA